MELTAENVWNIFAECLGGDPDTSVIVDGITNRFGFLPNKLDEHRESIESMLAQLPDEFHENTGGGWSFLNSCNTRDGVQWGEHRNMEQLFALGMGIDKVECQLPRDMWAALPGGMPYYVVKA